MDWKHPGVGWRKAIASGGTALPNQDADRYFLQDIAEGACESEAEAKDLMRAANTALNDLAKEYGGDVLFEAVCSGIDNSAAIEALEETGAIFWRQSGELIVGFPREEREDYILGAQSKRKSISCMPLAKFLEVNDFPSDDEPASKKPPARKTGKKKKSGGKS